VVYGKTPMQGRGTMTAAAPESDKNDNNKYEESTFDFITRRAAELNHDYSVLGTQKHYVTKAEPAKQKKEWEENCKIMREQAKKEDPIVKYCDDIRGIKPYYELSFEEMQELEAENNEERKHRMDELITSRFTDNKRSAKEERKQYRLDKNQQKKDRQLENTTPIRLFEDRLWKVGWNVRVSVSE
jgi:hypothetical protein